MGCSLFLYSGDTQQKKILCSGIAITLVCVFIIPCLNAWHKEYKFMKALKKDPNTSETGIFV